MRHDLPLAGVTVLELGVRIGASVAGSTLAQLGATVVFAEAPPPGAAPTKSGWREQFAAGKLSLLVNRDDAVDRQLLGSLADACDVLLVSSDTDPPELRDVARDGACCIVCDITAFGSSGPMAGEPCSDAQIQALSGILEATGTTAGGPVCVGAPLIEHMAGLYAAGAVLCALRQKRLLGLVQPVEVSLYDVAFAAMTSFLAPALHGDRRMQTRVGNRHTMAAPWNVYQAGDGWVLLCAGSDEQWRRICGLMGRPELADDPRYAQNADRVTNVDGVDAAVQAWMGLRDVAECVARLNELGLPCGPVVPIEGYPREANLEHRGMVLETFDPVRGEAVKVPGSAFRMSRTPGKPLLRIPLPDADRAEIVRLAERVRAASAPTGDAPQRAVLAGVRVVEVGHYTTVPVAARTLASLGAEVIKIEPLEGEAVRRWPPTRSGQGIFFTFQNTDKKSVSLDLDSQAGRDLLAKLVASADILVENLRPGALARKGFSAQDLQRLNPRLVYCSISGFGSDSLYPGRAAFDMVIQAMSGLMDVTRAEGLPTKAGPSIADVTGAAFGFVAMLAALEYRDATGLGQHVDLSMQDISAASTQTRWNRAKPASAAPVQALETGGFALGVGATAVPILDIGEVLEAPQTAARKLWFNVDVDGVSFPLIAVPFRLQATPAVVREPAPPLGFHTRAFEEALADISNQTESEHTP